MSRLLNIIKGAETPENQALLNMLFDAHVEAAERNDNASSLAFQNSWEATNDSGAAIISAIATTGKHHAPVVRARQVLFRDPDETVKAMIRYGHKIPGFGNSFHKEEIDPAFRFVAMYLSQLSEWERLIEVQSWLTSHKGRVIPINAAGITAAVAEHLSLDLHETLWLFLAPRMISWLSLTSS